MCVFFFSKEIVKMYQKKLKIKKDKMIFFYFACTTVVLRDGKISKGRLVDPVTSSGGGDDFIFVIVGCFTDVVDGTTFGCTVTASIDDDVGDFVVIVEDFTAVTFGRTVDIEVLLIIIISGKSLAPKSATPADATSTGDAIDLFIIVCRRPSFEHA